MQKNGETSALPVVQVISLQRTPQRRERFVEQNRGLAFAFFDAVDGSRVTRDHPGIRRLVPPGLQFYTAGAVGVALSHLTLWQRAERDNAVMTIAEDDAILRHDFYPRMQETIAGLPQDWDLIMWGWNFDSILSLHEMPNITTAVVNFDQERLRASIPAFQALDTPVHALRLGKCFGTCGYSISPSGARRFRENCFPLRNSSVYFPGLNQFVAANGIDIAMNAIYPLSRSFVCFPPLVVSRNEHAESTTLRSPPAQPAAGTPGSSSP